MIIRVSFASVFLCVSALMGAELQLASPFTDHTVLQRNMPIPVWGKAVAGTEVTVTFAGQSKTGTTDDSGQWRVTLDSLSGSAEGRSFQVESGDSKLSLEDVVVGEVWICSGQSNMQMGRGAVAELKGLSEVNLRTFEVKRRVAFTEQDTLEGEWAIAGPASAVAFGFSHFLSKQVDVPVGVIVAAWGSSSIEAWMPRDMVETLPHFKTIMEEWDANTEAQDRIRAALAEGKWSGNDDVFMRRQSNILYNAMIKPLVPFACRGLVWYQGERNTRFITGMPKEPWYMRVAGVREYDETLKAWIERYRKEWQQPDFHFLLVMLPGYGKLLDTGSTMDPQHPDSHSWAWMRESQMAALDLPNVGVANTIDLGDTKNIHPKDKAPIGERLALLAARQTLGQEVVAHGPVFSRVEKKGDRLVVHFDQAKGLKTTDENSPAEFWLTDSTGSEWKPALAKISGNTVELISPEMKDPAHVRYAFTGKPDVNLVNDAGLPAYPFRTDSFK